MKKNKISNSIKYEIVFETEYVYNKDLNINLCKGIIPLPHQFRTLKWMDYRSNCKIRGGILGLKMGLGKTGCGILRTAKKRLFKKKNVMKLFLNENKVNKNLGNLIYKYAYKETGISLVVLPKSAISTWEDEIVKFVGEQLKVLVYHRDSMKTKFNTISYEELCQYDIVIITYETLSSIAKKYGVFETLLEKDGYDRNSGINIPIYTKKIKEKLPTIKGSKLLFYNLWEDVYADESHRLTNPKRLTFYSMMALHAKYKWCLTGSIINNYTRDLYAQLKWLGGCEEFANQRQFSYDEYIKKELYKAVLIMSYEDAGIKLPPIIRKTEILEFDQKENEMYQYYQNATKDVYNDFIVGGNSFASVLTMFLRLRQVCICPHTVLDKSKNDKKNEEFNTAQKTLDKISGGLVSWLNNINGSAGMYSTKINRLVEIIKKEIPKNESVLVFTNFKKAIDVIIKRFKKEKISYTLFDGDVKSSDRKKNIEKFRNKTAQVFLATFKAGSESLNLSDISHNVIFCEEWWSPKSQDQGEMRVYRYGQKNIVRVWKLMMKNSIDIKMDEMCNHKRELSDLFMNGKGSKKNTNLNAQLLGTILGIKN
jgi:SNF2 family DNA or RNA helicase